MISAEQIPALRNFRAVEETFPLDMGMSWSGLVSATDNASAPVHRWFRFKESFSPDLLLKIVQRFAIGRTFSLLDPFCGVGTSLLSAQELAGHGFTVHSVGIERNPFIAFVARTKLLSRSVAPDCFLELGDQAIGRASKHAAAVPGLSSLSSGRCISRYTARRIGQLAAAIRCVADGPARDLLLLGLAACVERVSKTRKDGRALRIVRQSGAPLYSTLRAQWAVMAEDMAFSRRVLPLSPDQGTVIEGDGREPQASLPGGAAFDLIVTSPPYPNNIDYSEVYKLELWLFKHVCSATEFLDLRRLTFRSHPTCLPAERSADYDASVERGELQSTVGALLGSLSTSPERWRVRVLDGYCADLWASMKAHWGLLRAGGYAIYVVGNSLHGGSESPYLVPTDVITAQIARSVGFEVESISVARSLVRRLVGNHFLRESLVVLRKP